MASIWNWIKGVSEEDAKKAKEEEEKAKQTGLTSMSMTFNQDTYADEDKARLNALLRLGRHPAEDIGFKLSKNKE